MRRRAIEATFARGQTAIPSTPSIGLSDVFAQNTTKQWRAFLKKNKLDPTDLGNVARGHPRARPAVRIHRRVGPAGMIVLGLPDGRPALNADDRFQAAEFGGAGFSLVSAFAPGCDGLHRQDVPDSPV